MNKSVLVVGGAGYIGGATVDLLLEAGWLPVVYDNLLYEDRYFKHVPFIYGDIRDTQKVVEAAEDFDCKTVILLAAIVGDPACNVNQELTRDVNFVAIKNICEQLPKDVRVIFMSTCSVYGASQGVVDEESPTNPLSSYASTKLQAEKHVLQRDGLVFRLGTVFGLGDRFSRIRADLVVNTLTIKAFTKGEVTVNGGLQWRPIIAVGDIAGYVEEACRNSLTGKYILAYKNTTIKDLAHEVVSNIPDTKINYIDSLFQDERTYQVDNAKSLNSFSYKPHISVSDEVRVMYDLLKQRRIKDPENINYVNGLFLSHKRL